MPRKVLITKDTLEEILAKYQGGGGSSAGGSGKLYQYDFTLKVYDNSAEPEYHLSFLLYESNFERLKQMAAQQGIIINSPQDIATFINSLAQTTTQTDPTYVLQFVLFGALVDKVLNTDRGFFEELVADIFVAGFYGPEGQSTRISLANDTTEPPTYYGLNTNNSCTLTEYGTSASGGTAEAEPIVSIKMTNLDVRVMTSDEQKIGDFEFYLTKDRWDNFVSLASSQFQIDITYQNFDSVFKSLDAQTQRFALGYLLMDYYTKEILPDAIISYISNMPYTTGAKIKTPLSLVLTTSSSQTNNIEIVYLTGFTDSTVNIYDIDKGGVDLVTSNTVITVEEIEGASIGASGGSGESEPIIEKITITDFKLVSNQTEYTTLDLWFTSDKLTEMITYLNNYLQNGANITLTRDNFSQVWQDYSGLRTAILDFIGNGAFLINVPANNAKIQNFVTSPADELIACTFHSEQQGSAVLSSNVISLGNNSTLTLSVVGSSSGGSGSSVAAPEYYEITLYVSTVRDGQTIDAHSFITMTKQNLDFLIATANQQLSSMGYTLTLDNWSTLVPQLANASRQLRAILVKGLIMYASNIYSEDEDGVACNSLAVVTLSNAATLGNIGILNSTFDTIASSSAEKITLFDINY